VAVPAARVTVSAAGGGCAGAGDVCHNVVSLWGGLTVFSGGRDTISLRHASLHADTIWILMLVKKRLHLACAKANAALCH
jgi:hypothetical protein